MWKWVLALVTTCLPGLSALVGDSAVLHFPSGSLQKAFVDNLTHAVVAFWSWLVVACITSFDTRLKARDWTNAAVCCLAASLTDLDHFYLAGSLSVQDALHPGNKRGPLHCTSLWLVTSAAIFSIAELYDSDRMYTTGWVLLVASLSHHIRDANRRGLWLWPFGSTQPLSTPIYVFLTTALPVIVGAVRWSCLKSTECQEAFQLKYSVA